MVHSMTGYAVASGESPRGALALELRSVNSRYLDVQLRIADELRSAEPMLRELIVARIARGKVDCRLSLTDTGRRAQHKLDPQTLERLRQLQQVVREKFPDAAPLGAADVLRWPGVLTEPPADEEPTRAMIERLCRAALDELCAARAREGAKLATIVLGRIADMKKRLAEAAPLVPEAIAAFKAKLEERLREALGAGNEERIRAEIALFATRTDVDEELTRLAAHIQEVERTLGGAEKRSGAPVGKRLDFLAQELNREANTLASKAAGLKLSDCALELKLLIEQVREQVQNIE
ncbi:MAG TPA: YicC/YloC family endoribonuclease [Burkholderiales bacterium]|jgi:uncharacterized protein (TIGR00255 family)|nr:YicC/YloC family endoribonuclease [Burkholderiales bacterium]